MIALGNLIQFQDMNGSLLAAGYVFVYHLGRSELATIYNDHNGAHVADNPVRLDDMGMCDVYLNECYNYTVVVMDAYGQEMFSRDIYPDKAGGGDGRYEGVDPIVVNNDVNVISANTTRFGVQEPLYFVRDDESATIIGFSGAEVPAGTMNESAFGYQDGKITGYNGSAFSAGNTYEEGSYIDIDGNTISVTGLTPVPADTASTGLVASVSADITAMIPDTSDMATKTWVNEQGFLTAHQDLSAYAKTEDLTAYQPVGNYYSASNPSGFINSDAISAMATTGFVADVSGDITAMIPSTAGLATEDWVTGQGYLTAHQSLDGLMSADLLEISDNKITGYNGTAFAGQGGGGVSGDFTLVEGNGIQLTDDPIAQTTTISVSGDYATHDDLTSKQDSLTYGYHDTAISSIDNSALYDNSAHARITTLAGRISDLSSNKLDSSAFSDVSGTFLTAVDLTPYQLTADMTAYQPVGDYLTTADSANFYTTANESGFISEVPDTYLQNTDLSTTDGKVTAISGIPLSAGGDVPEGVMVESGLEYNAVNEISGYNGSAIAQYGAEKQWLVHDDTLVHAANSAQYALGVNLSAVAQLLGVDETELLASTANNTFTLSEPFSSFKQVKIKLRWWDKVPDNYYDVERFTNNKCSLSWTYFDNVSDPSPLELAGASWTSNNGIDYNFEAGFARVFATATTAISQFTHNAYPISIIGIGRKQ